MLQGVLLLLLLLVASTTLVGAKPQWTALTCPTSKTAKGCSTTNPHTDVDAVVSLFFQMELAPGQTIGRFSCSSTGAGGELVHCSRTWLPTEGGSSGSCWFILGAGESYSCQGEGQVNFMGSNIAPLASKVLAGSPPAPIPCLSGAVAAGGSCDHTAGASDEWLSLSWALGAATAATSRRTAVPPLHSFSCTYSGVQVCSYSANTTDTGQERAPTTNATVTALRGASCAFLLPAGEKLTCDITSGGVSFATAASRPLTKPIYGATATALPSNYTCPDPPTAMYPDGTKGNPCGCGWKNPHSDKDIVIAINALSNNEG